MNYVEWLVSVPREITDDPLWRNEVYRLALFLGDLAWKDAEKLCKHLLMRGLADQLYRATGSISANIAEGYSRASKKDQARFYEYALGSAREARDWYFKARFVLGPDVTNHRLRLLVEITKHLMRMVPSYRGKTIREEKADYVARDLALLNDIPMPD
ncbi:MAG: four helix bundle protein [Caldilineaceae bacterium]